jgi:hypothetical protein
MSPQIARDQPRADVGRGTGPARDQQLHRFALEKGFVGLRLRSKASEEEDGKPKHDRQNWSVAAGSDRHG